MKKLLVALVAMLAAGAAMAQAPFTIVRPNEGQKVRETVNIVFPRGSVPAGSFIGVSVDGKFVEATVPVFDAKANGLVYRLDTKAKRIEDGNRTISVALYARQDGRPAIVERTETSVIVGNHMDINVPANGFQLTYRWARGTQSVYSVLFGQEIATMTEAQNRLGGRAAQMPLGQETVRVLIAVDDVKPGGVGLVRTQLLPYVGRDYVVATASGDNEPRKHNAVEFAPIYQLLRPTGHEIYADIPQYWGMEGTQGGRPTDRDLLVFMPKPILPAERVHVGDSWQASIPLATSTIPEVQDTGTMVERIPARGTFESVEWEQGHPTAKLRYELEFSERNAESRELQVAGREFRGNDRTRFQQIVWVSLRDGRMVRSDFLIEADMRIPDQQQQQQQQQTGGVQGGRTGGRGGALGVTGADAGGGAGGGAAEGGGRTGGGAGLGGEAPTFDARPPAPPSGPGGMAPGRPGGGAAPNRGAAFVRTRLYIKMLIEQ